MCVDTNDAPRGKGRDLTKWAKDSLIRCIEIHIDNMSEGEPDDMDQRNAISSQLKRLRKFLGGK